METWIPVKSMVMPATRVQKLPAIVVFLFVGLYFGQPTGLVSSQPNRRVPTLCDQGLSSTVGVPFDREVRTILENQSTFYFDRYFEYGGHKRFCRPKKIRLPVGSIV
jgi:hypothetical protein